jgi:hypothetical protein
MPDLRNICLISEFPTKIVYLCFPYALCMPHASHVFDLMTLLTLHGARRNAVVEALCYKLEDRGFEIRGGERLLYIYLILPAALGYWGLLRL